MNAVTFFKSMGLKAVKQYLENDNIRTKEMHDELKQIVDAFELVEKAGGIDNAKGICSVEDTHYLGCKLPNCDDLKQAINLVEQCYA